MRPLLPPPPARPERVDIELPPALARTFIRASLEPPAEGESRWNLVIVPAAGPATRVPIGTCVCCSRPLCPQGAHLATAKRILRGDHPTLFRPPYPAASSASRSRYSTTSQFSNRE